MGFDVVANLIGAGIAMALALVLIVFMVFTTGGRFGRAIKKHPHRALEHIRADGEAWVLEPQAEAGSQTAVQPREGLQGPYRLEMPDGTTYTFFGRPEGMDASMKRFLARLPH